MHSIRPPICLLSLGFWLCLTSTGVPAESGDAAEPPGDRQAPGKFLGAVPTTYPGWFKTSFLELEEDLLEAREAGKRVMLLFHQDNCPYCNAFVERNLAQKDIVETLQQHFDVIELNMWGDREVINIEGTALTEKSFASTLNVQFTPTIIFLAPDGSQALRINGYYTPERFRLVLRYLLEAKPGVSLNTFIERHQQSESDAPDALVPRSYHTGPIDELHERPGKHRKPLLIMFGQTDCRNCIELHDNVLMREQSLSLLEHFDVYQVDLWGNTPFAKPDGTETSGRIWGAELDINYAPTLVLFSADGQEVIRSEAWFKAFHTQSILDYVASDAWREEPSFQRFLSARAEQIRHQGEDVDIWD